MLKGKKKADKETNEGNHTPNTSEPIELDLFELEVRDANIYSVSTTLSRFFHDRHDLLEITYDIKIEPKTKRWPKDRSGWFSKTGSRGLDEVNELGCYCCLSVNAISFSMSATKGEANWRRQLLNMRML